MKMEEPLKKCGSREFYSPKSIHSVDEIIGKFVELQLFEFCFVLL